MRDVYGLGHKGDEVPEEGGVATEGQEALAQGENPAEKAPMADGEGPVDAAPETDDVPEGEDCDPDCRGRRRKPVTEMSPKELGDEGERIAADYLARQGYEILERNWTCYGGEADIIANAPECFDRKTCVLVEVKTRLALGESAEELPELAVDVSKQRRYRQIALNYLVLHPEVNSIRFDVIAINVVGESSAKLRHLISAYELDD